MAVCWTVEEEKDSERQFELGWTEDLSSDLPEEFAAESREGFGTKLTTRIVPAMLNGRAERHFVEGEFRYCLTAPLKTIQSASDRSEGETLAARLIDERFGLDDSE